MSKICCLCDDIADKRDEDGDQDFTILQSSDVDTWNDEKSKVNHIVKYLCTQCKSNVQVGFPGLLL